MRGDHRNQPQPFVRLIGAGILLCGCLCADHKTAGGIVALPAVAILSVVLNQIGVRAVVKLILAGGIFYAPMVFLASPGIAIKGLSATVVGLATFTSLGSQALHDGILRLPLPTVVRLLVLQMVHQTAVLRRETLCIHQALVVRGGVHGIRGIWEFGKALPLVWVPRVVFRAERVGMAMEMREYGAILPTLPAVSWRGRDIALLVCTSGIAMAAVYLSGFVAG